MAVFYSLTWSWGDYAQSVARLHRQGQKSSVRVVRLLVRGTVDEHVMTALRRKKGFSQALRDSIRRGVV